MLRLRTHKPHVLAYIVIIVGVLSGLIAIGTSTAFFFYEGLPNTVPGFGFPVTGIKWNLVIIGEFSGVVLALLSVILILVGIGMQIGFTIKKSK